jgi:hypothetical protein
MLMAVSSLRAGLVRWLLPRWLGSACCAMLCPVLPQQHNMAQQYTTGAAQPPGHSCAMTAPAKEQGRAAVGKGVEGGP